MKRATSVARDQLVSLGVCVGKFTHSDKFRLTIGALELLAAHAKHKVSYAAAFGETYRFAAKQRFFFDEGGFFFFLAPRRVGRPVMRRISVFNLNLCDEKRLIPRALEGRRDATRELRDDASLLSAAKSYRVLFFSRLAKTRSFFPVSSRCRSTSRFPSL